MNTRKVRRLRRRHKRVNRWLDCALAAFWGSENTPRFIRKTHRLMRLEAAIAKEQGRTGA